MGPVAEIRELAKHYGHVRAVDRISLDVAAGEIYALLGLNGAGKTTAIRTMLGMIAPTAGSVHLFGQLVTAANRQIWARVGYLVETPASYPELTVKENLRVTAKLKHLPVRAADEIVAALGLRPYAARRSRDLSLGNQQRLGLAKALLGRPRLLVLDEPANGLDPAGVTEIRHLLKTLAAQGTAILMSSHILAEVAKLATRIGIIHEGRLITEIAATDVPQHVRRWLEVRCRDQSAAVSVLRREGYEPLDGSDSGIILESGSAVRHPDTIATALVHAGCPPTRLAVQEEDLETLFLRLTGQAAKQ